MKIAIKKFFSKEKIHIANTFKFFINSTIYPENVLAITKLSKIFIARFVTS